MTNTKKLDEIEFTKAEAVGLGFDTIRKIADLVREQLNVDFPIEIKKVIEKLDGIIKYNYDFDQPDGSIFIYDNKAEVKKENKFVIYLSPFTSEARDTFTLAHELGHYVLHYLYPKQKELKILGNTYRDRFGNDLAETEANVFAANFLMPEQDFRDLYIEFKGDLGQISDALKISNKAAYFRAKALKMV